jgi:hypothetical protein
MICQHIRSRWMRLASVPLFLATFILSSGVGVFGVTSLVFNSRPRSADSGAILYINTSGMQMLSLDRDLWFHVIFPVALPLLILSALSAIAAYKGFNESMNTSQKIGFTAVSLFGVSHLLPAYPSTRGFACFQECWRIMWNDTPDFGWLYYSGFAFSNIIFPILVAALFVSTRGWRFRSIASFIILLHTTSWSVLQPDNISDIKIGYYVWLAAYALLYSASIQRAEQLAGANSRGGCGSALT